MGTRQPPSEPAPELPSEPAPRIGVLRPDRPRPVVALAEARVVRTELERRIGRVTVDLRVDGDPIGDWQPRVHAAWPADVDAVVEPGTLWAPGLPPLTTLFARTVAPAAAEVRRRMLHHLGVLPLPTLDDAVLTELERLPLRPTDLWLIATSAAAVAVDDPAVVGFAAGHGLDALDALDAAFDAAADAVATGDAVDRSLRRQLGRLRALHDAAAARAAGLTDELARSEREATTRLDGLEDELRVVRERLERCEDG